MADCRGDNDNRKTVNCLLATKFWGQLVMSIETIFVNNGSISETPSKQVDRQQAIIVPCRNPRQTMAIFRATDAPISQNAAHRKSFVPFKFGLKMFLTGCTN